MSNTTEPQVGALVSFLAQDQIPAMHVVQHSAHLNNLGAHYISIGEDRRAFGAFKRALEVVQQAAAADMDFDAQPRQQTTNIGDLSIELMSPVVAIPFDCERNEKALFGTAEDEDKSFYFVYSKPFVFDSGSLDVACTPIYIAIVIFNMTLLLLRKAVTDNADKRSLFKALRLFDVALLLLRSAPTHADSNTLLLAVLNNKVHVCFCIHEFDDAHATLEELSGLLPIVCDEGSTLEESELSGMILNTLLKTDPTRLAPAA